MKCRTGDPQEKLRVSDRWVKRLGSVTVKFSTQGAVGEGYIHDCECKHGDTTSATSAQTRGNQLNREQIEHLPQFVKFLSQYTS